LPVTVVTVAFGNPEVIKRWGQEWSGTGAACLISDNGNLLPRDLSSKVAVLPFRENTGFGSGINRAVQKADTPVVLITNPDTLPENPHSLESLLHYHSEGSLTGGITVDASGRVVHSTGIWPTSNWVRSQVFHKAESLWNKNTTDWLQGSLIMVNTDDFLKLNGFSSSYPLYFEDVDICARAHQEGMSINFSGNSRFIHDEGSGSAGTTATRLSFFHWGMLQYFRDHDPLRADRVRKMILTKCILRTAGYLPGDPGAAKGYYRAFMSILAGAPPTLPEVHDG
jgi:GT2 family glycosyltransferase